LCHERVGLDTADWAAETQDRILPARALSSGSAVIAPHGGWIMQRLDRTLAERWAALALANVARPYPYKLDQLLHADLDARPPRAIHPAFWGSYDWHSCVHMHWTLVRLLRRCPDHRCAAETVQHLSERLTAASIEGELASLARPGHASFERPYGWGWLLKLAAELDALASERTDLAGPALALAPLARAIADRWLDYLPRVDYPTRAGTHGNTAFALLLTLDYAEAVQHRALVTLIGQRVERWYGRDRRYPADYEPSGEDFLSPGLVEAALVRRAVDGCSFADWWVQFEPSAPALAAWLTPARVGDPRDPKIVHLHGLNLSRAWCWRQLLPELPASLAGLAERTIEEHLAASLPASIDGEYVGTHWLASFALLAVDGA
jgi:hypothetical protein